jgi:pimeloyl-ACP methyl ester carboxylesterase/heme-degrading monooxygenase HmoA
MAKVILSDESKNVAFIQVWKTPNPDDQQQLLQIMKTKMGMFKHLPGFISMSLHPSLDGTQLAVYAQWRSQEDFEAAVANNPQAQEERREFTKYGEHSGTLYTLAAVQVAEAKPAIADLSSQFTHHTAEVNGVRLHYVIGGSGDPVILLHGNTSTWYEWRKVMPALAEHYTVIVPDLRGFGDSSRPETGYDKCTLGEDIYQLAIQLGCKRFFLVGHDWGGPTAYALTAAHPEAVRRLVIVESIIPGTQFAETDSSQNTWFYSFHQAPNFAEVLIEGREREYLSWCYQHFSYNPAAITEADIDEYVRTYSAPGAIHAIASLYRTIPTDIEHNQANLV